MKKITKGFMFILLNMILISCSYDNSTADLLLSQNAITATGVNWDTGKLVAINPFEDKQILPCRTDGDILTPGERQYYSDLSSAQAKSSVRTKNNIECNAQNTPKIVFSENSLQDKSIRQALELTQAPIKGVVKVNGKSKEARFVVTVTALYTGSHCQTTYGSGSSYTTCINNHQYCKRLEKHGSHC